MRFLHDRPTLRALRRLALVVLVASSACARESPDQTAPVVNPPPPAYDVEASNIDLWLETMEVGSRELYAAREAVIAAIGVQEGDAIADIGAGTGLYALLFAQRTGARGVIYAVDIEPRFLKLINQRAADSDLRNVVAVLGREDDITLPHNSIDFAFIADTYHYFSDPAPIMASVREALRPGGRVILLDYNLDPSTSKRPELDHVRGGKAETVAEIESFGFKLQSEPMVPGLSEIYMAVLKRDEQSAKTE